MKEGQEKGAAEGEGAAVAAWNADSQRRRRTTAIIRRSAATPAVADQSQVTGLGFVAVAPMAEQKWRGMEKGGGGAAAAAAAGLLSLRSSLVALSKHGEKVREISGGYWGHLERGEIGLGSDISVTPHQISKQRTGQTGARQKKASKPGLNQQQKPNTRV